MCSESPCCVACRRYVKRSQASVVENRPPGSATASSSCSQGTDCAASSNHNSTYASPVSEGVSWSAGSSNGSSCHSEPYNGRNGTCDGEPQPSSATLLIYFLTFISMEIVV